MLVCFFEGTGVLEWEFERIENASFEMMEMRISVARGLGWETGGK